MEQLVIEKINDERVLIGRQPLKFDTLLAPAGDHHALYMRKLGKLTHWQDEDVEGMEEYEFPTMRLALLDRSKIEDLSEAIGSGVVSLKGSYFADTYDEISSWEVDGFKQSYAHWVDITNKKWDCIYVVYDFLSDESKSSSGTYITIILGKYKD